MEKILGLGSGDLPIFLLAFFRVTGVMIPAPLFGSGVVPPMVKAFLSVVLAILFFPFVGHPSAPIETGLAAYAFLVLQELSVGLLIGFTAALLFAAIQMGGQLIDQELGLATATLLDPVTNEQVSIISQFKLLLATMIYLLIDGHHLLIRAVADSFRAIPIGWLRIGKGAATHLSDTLVRDLFRMAVQIAAPSIVTLFLITIALAFMARAVPEMNIFVLSFSLRVGVGLAVVTLGIGVFVAGVGEALRREGPGLHRLLVLLGT
jgi:flagellar biosynthetic protein FliR